MISILTYTHHYRYVFPGAEVYPDPDSSDVEEDDDLDGSERNEDEDGDMGEHEVVSDPPCLESTAEASPQPDQDPSSDKILVIAE